MNVIRHDHVPAHSPAVTISRPKPFVRQNVCDVISCKDSTSILRACRDEINRLVDPNTVESSQMLMHRCLLQLGSLTPAKGKQNYRPRSATAATTTRVSPRQREAATARFGMTQSD